MIERKYEQCAAQFVKAVKEIASKPDNLDNIECYLSMPFKEWMGKYASTPETLVYELKMFAEMII